MTIPLDTYDPDWKAKWQAIYDALQKENRKPVDERSQSRAEALLTELHAAFHTQFRTTGDYAEWTEQNVRDFAKSQGVPDFKVPRFERDGSVERTRNLYSLLVDRIKIEANTIYTTLELDYPAAGQAFALELDKNETRTTSVMTHEYNMPTFEGSMISGVETRTAPYGYLIEHRNACVNVCFFQLSDEGPGPINCVEDLATKLYNTELGTAVLAQGKKYYPPGNVNFYIYIPPRVHGEERFVKVGLTWVADELQFVEPEWDHPQSVPYVLRKQAAADGLAKDPGAPRPPKTWSPKGPRRDNG